jgi:hypothetical protein
VAVARRMPEAIEAEKLLIFNVNHSKRQPPIARGLQNLSQV